MHLLVGCEVISHTFRKDLKGKMEEGNISKILTGNNNFKPESDDDYGKGLMCLTKFLF